MNISPEHFGKKIKRFRLLNDIRQEDMAEKLKVSRATLINYEKGHTAINLEVLNRINDIYPNDLKHKGDGLVNSSRKILNGK